MKLFKISMGINYPILQNHLYIVFIISGIIFRLFMISLGLSLHYLRYLWDYLSIIYDISGFFYII